VTQPTYGEEWSPDPYGEDEVVSLRVPTAAAFAPGAAAPPSHPAFVPLSASAPPAPRGEWVTVGQWFQPVPGGVLPRPGADDPCIAVVLAVPGTPVHAITGGTVRRAVGTATPGAVELRAPDGAVFVYIGSATVAWTTADDEAVPAGAVLGVVVGAVGDPPTEHLQILAVDASGSQLDAVALLVGLPDPGELGLRLDGSGLGLDPFRRDLEIAGRVASRGGV
jgi:hypothetical protein